MKTKKDPKPILAAVFLTPLMIFSSCFIAVPAEAARSIVFPVIGPASFTNDYTVPRPNGIHGATDIMASKGQKLVAAVDGVISFVAYPQPSYGYDVEITDDEGYTYMYLHINDDTPGTNDGKGGAMNAYAPDMKVGNRVHKGQLIGYNGDSGYSNGVPHLHFEIIDPNNNNINPYESLVNATRLNEPVGYPQLANENLPYGSDFKGGGSIAMGNLDADASTEFITGPGPTGGPHVRKFDHNSSAMGNDFMAYHPNFYGGIDVATGDVNGDDVDDIITGPGPTGGPNVKVFKADGTLISSFMAYDPNFTGGIDVAAADVVNTSEAEIVTSPGPGGGPNVKVFNAKNEVLNSFFAYSEGFRGGVRVSAGNVRTSTPKAEILTSPASPPGGSHIRLLNHNGSVIKEINFMEEWWEGYHDVAAGEGASLAMTGGNRRTSVRAGIY